jgi:tetratricopeptide (TPR) repeat protein
VEKTDMIRIRIIFAHFIILAVICGIILLFGLFSQITPLLDVLIGNNHYTRGEYGQSIIHYHKALDRNRHEPYIYYDLGNVYAALGENAPALDTLHKALAGQNHDLLFRTNFNLGILYYESGQFEEAVNHFIDALKAEPDSVEAKINLELALKKLKSQSTTNTKISSKQQENQLNEQSQQIIDLIKKREEVIWQLQKKKTQTIDTQNDW